jgi:hypothetical protein
LVTVSGAGSKASTPTRIVEQSTRGTYIRKYRDLQRIFDHEAELERIIRAGIGLMDEVMGWTCGLKYPSPRMGR